MPDLPVRPLPLRRLTGQPTEPDRLSVWSAMMATMPSLDRGPLVGRDDDVRQLAALLGLGTAPTDPRRSPDDGTDAGAAVVLGGDAGVGKTRVLTELAERARAQGVQVLVGHCLDFGEAGLPYLPFTEAFGRLAAEQPALITTLLADQPTLKRLLPAGRELSGPPTPMSTDRSALLDAVRATLAALGRQGRTLLIVEDVHWADPSTRELLTVCFSVPLPAGVVLMASYRSDDLHRTHPLRSALGQWQRLSQVTRVQLDPLDATGTAALAQSLRAGTLPAAELRRIVARADGNPFFVEELLAAGGSADTLPTELADLLLVRVDNLTDDARRPTRAARGRGRRPTGAAHPAGPGRRSRRQRAG